MSAGARIAAFVALLAVVFAGAALAGGALDPGAGADGVTPHGHAATTPATSVGSEHAASGHGSAAAAATSPAGLASAEGGYRLVADTTRFRAGRPAPLGSAPLTWVLFTRAHAITLTRLNNDRASSGAPQPSRPHPESAETPPPDYHGTVDTAPLAPPRRRADPQPCRSPP